jgi:signal transduction histidine kinase
MNTQARKRFLNVLALALYAALSVGLILALNQTLNDAEDQMKEMPRSFLIDIIHTESEFRTFAQYLQLTSAPYSEDDLKIIIGRQQQLASRTDLLKTSLMRQDLPAAMTDAFSQELNHYDILIRELGTVLNGPALGASEFNTKVNSYLQSIEFSIAFLYTEGISLLAQHASQHVEILNSLSTLLSALVGIVLTLFAGLFFTLRKVHDQKTELQRAKEELEENLIELKSSKDVLERQAFDLAGLAEKEAALAEKLHYEVGVKDRFFSIISHDLKSPFTALLGMTHMMAELADSLSKEKLVEYAKDVNESGSRIFELLQNLLEWSRLQMKGGTFQPEGIQLEEVTQECIDILAPNAAAKNIKLINKIEHTPAFADRYMAQALIRNLIANAVKFTPSGGSVEVTCHQHDGNIQVTVADNGVGMTNSHAEKIFALDEKTSTQGTNGEVGTGLGLPLCKEMVEKCGGRIWVESELNEGSKFHFTLPMAPSAK